MKLDTTIKNFKLIEGFFDPKDAKKIITSLINDKINYHNLEDFSNHIRFSNDVSFSKKRVAELQETKNEVIELLDLAEKSGLKLEIKSTIEIKFVK